MIVFIDSGVLGILANPHKLGEANDCEQWLYRLFSQGVYICSSDLCDYEVRRKQNHTKLRLLAKSLL